MVARSEIDRKAASCLMLLSRVGECGGGGDVEEGRVYRCKTCMKEFSSFQALEGHRASHRKPVVKNTDKQSLSGSLTKKTMKTTSHICPICGVDFPMGQALGGHMRKHRNQKSVGELVTRSLLPETTTVTTLKKSSSGKRVACLDSGLDPMDGHNNLNLELGLGTSIY